MLKIKDSKSSVLFFSNEIVASRKAFLRELKKLPNPLNKIAIAHYHNRLERVLGQPVLGEYVLWLTADLLGINDHKLIKKLSISWLNVYTYIIFIDDIIDQHNQENKGWLLIAGSLLLERGLNEIFGLSASSKELLTAINKYSTETAIAAVSELKRHRHLIKHFNEKEILTVGRKIAFLKLWLIYMLHNRGITTNNLDLSSIDMLCSAIQLLDDITDWEEDLEAGNFTYPLTLTFKKLIANGIKRAKKPQELTANEVLLGMVQTGSLEDTIVRSNRLIRSVLNNAPQQSTNSPSRIFLSHVIRNNESFIETASNTKAIFLRERRQCREMDWLLDMIKNEKIMEELKGIRKSLSIVAQQS